jgi:putative tricarboxylic transport membrane protein
MRRKNIIAAIVLIVFATIYGGLTAYLPVRTLPHTPDPSFFPWINTAIILALSVGLLVQGLRLPASGPSQGGGGRQRRAVWTLGAFVIYLAAMPGLGFVLATIPFFAVMMVLFGERRPVRVGAGAVCATIFLYVLFRHGFGIFLPRGLLAGIVA